MADRTLRLFWDYGELLYWDTGGEANDEVYTRMGADFQRRVEEWGDDMNLAWGALHEDDNAVPPQSVIEDLQARHTALADEMRAQGFAVEPERKYTPKDDQRRPLYVTIRDMLNGWLSMRRQWPYGP